MSELTERQIYYRAYYAKNKEEICAKKRSQYVRKKPGTRSAQAQKPKRKKVSPREHGVAFPPQPVKATCPVVLVDKMPRKARHSIEDRLLAKELGINLEELN